MRILIYRWLERFFRIVSEWAQEATEQVALCPDCGRNRYTGKPCIKGED